jgi:hypothetical protein
MKNIIISILLLLSFNLSAQDTITKEPIRLVAYSTMDANDQIMLNYREQSRLKDSIINVLRKMEYEQFMDIPQAEINLGIHNFAKQHRTGNHLMIAGLISTTLGSLLMFTSNKSTTSSSTPFEYPIGVVFTAIGGGLTTAGFIVNIDSFRHLK